VCVIDALVPSVGEFGLAVDGFLRGAVIQKQPLLLVCVCVRERERERERANGWTNEQSTNKIFKQTVKQTNKHTDRQTNK